MIGWSEDVVIGWWKYKFYGEWMVDENLKMEIYFLDFIKIKCNKFNKENIECICYIFM